MGKREGYHMQANAASKPSTVSARISGTLNPIFRKGILVATNNRAVASGVRRYGMRLGGARFVAGETIDEAIPVLRSLNEAGLRTNTTLLGEHVDSTKTARAVVESYEAILDRIAAEELTTNVAVKLTHLGLDIGQEVAFDNVREIARHAAGRDNFVRIDMEESPRVDATLATYRRLRDEGVDNVGTVLQSSLYRSERDLDALLPLSPNLRLVKGAYLEPADVAYPKKSDVDAAYISLAERALLSDGFTAIATHDERIIDHVIAFTERHGLDRNRFEFQMLYGIKPSLQRDLAARGYRLLVATPFGPDWYAYLMRRLAERPANLAFVLRGAIRR
jgi:proline dehydrogenase